MPAEHNRGGLVVQYGKIRGFVPASQLMRFPRRLSETQKMERLKEIVDTEEAIPLKIIEVDRRRRRLILSQREAWWEWKEQRKRDLLDQLEEGQEVEGTVTSLRDFGAFVDLGGADGLIHVSELSWQHVSHPRELLKVGQKVQAKVLNLDRNRLRIGLSLKQMEQEPWSQIDEVYTERQLIEGVVTRVAEFGAFVRLPEGIEGLVHVSELADIEPERPGDLVKDGDLLLLRIIRIDPQRRRIGLSLRQVTEAEWSEWVATFEEQETKEAPASEEEGAAAEVEAEAEEAIEVLASEEEAIAEATAVVEAEAEEAIEVLASEEETIAEAAAEVEAEAEEAIEVLASEEEAIAEAAAEVEAEAEEAIEVLASEEEAIAEAAAEVEAEAEEAIEVLASEEEAIAEAAAEVEAEAEEAIEVLASEEEAIAEAAAEVEAETGDEEPEGSDAEETEE